MHVMREYSLNSSILVFEKPSNLFWDAESALPKNTGREDTDEKELEK
jgi:hypothetical protein